MRARSLLRLSTSNERTREAIAKRDTREESEQEATELLAAAKAEAAEARRPLAEVRWGLLGAGDVCEVKSGPPLYKSRGSRLVAVMRRTSAKAADFAKRHGVRRWYDDAQSLIADASVNALYIASPPGTHLELAL